MSAIDQGGTTQRPPEPLGVEDLVIWLGKPRAQRYLDAAKGDHVLAGDLYAWNARVAAAAFTDTSHLEVALRNAYDRTMCEHTPDWSILPGLPLLQFVAGHPSSYTAQRKMNKRSADEIRRAASGLGASPTHGRVVAATTFGFWTQLTHPHREASFWTHMIRDAYPAGTTRGHVHDLVTTVNRFRNRLAHNEPVFSVTTGLSGRMSVVNDLLTLLSPTVGTWVAEHSSVADTVNECPIPGLLVWPPRASQGR